MTLYLRRAIARGIRFAILMSAVFRDINWRANYWLHLWRHNLEYQGRPDDILIVSYPKSGTSWVQMIVYQLASGGKVDFEHIQDVCPHFEATMLLYGKRINDLRPPRLVKSHLSYGQMPKGAGRYIYVLRDGKDVAISYFHHHKKYQLGEHVFPRFLRDFLSGKIPYGSWFKHASAWTANRNKLNMLVVHYEDLIADLEGEVRRLAAFCGMPIAEENLANILRHCSFEYMQEHDEKFGLENMAARARSRNNVKFIRKGVVGEGAERLDKEALSAYRKRFDRYLPTAIFDRYR